MRMPTSTKPDPKGKMVTTSPEKVKKIRGPQIGEVLKKKRKLLFAALFATKKAKVYLMQSSILVI